MQPRLNSGHWAMFCFKFGEGVVRDPGNRSGQEQDSFLSVRLVFLRSGAKF